jgi:hypothetical protein
MLGKQGRAQTHLTGRERDQKKTNKDQKKQIRIKKKQIGIKKNKIQKT